MMRLLDRLFTRRRRLPRFDNVAEIVRHRLAVACLELTEAEDQAAAQLELVLPPRLLLVDEETAVVLTAEDRRKIALSAAKAHDQA